MIWKAGIWKKYYVFHLSDFTIQYWESQVVLVQCFVLSTTQRPYFFVNFWLSPDDPTYFCIFLSLNAENHALTQWPLIFWACALTECPSLLEDGPYTRIHFIFDCPPLQGLFLCKSILIQLAGLLRNMNNIINILKEVATFKKFSIF